MPGKQSEFVQRLHAGFGISPAALTETVRAATGDSLLVHERIVRGAVNEVYRVRTSRAGYIVRIDRSGGADFTAEAWAMREAHKAGVPAPEVLLVDRVQDQGDDLPVMVVSVLPGRPLADLEADLSQQALQRLLFSAGQLLTTLHSVRTPGVWKPEADSSWNTWNDIKDGFLAERRSEREELISAGLSEAETSTVLDLVARSIRDYPWTDPILCHGDFVPDHIFVDDTLEICGLLDFGMFHGGPPVSDLAYLRFARPDLDQAAVLAGYGVDETDQDFLLRRDLHAITQAVGYTAHSVHVGDSDRASAHVEALRSLIHDVLERTR